MREIVGVLRGGPSSEYEVSLNTGASVLRALNAEKYEARDIFISRGGEWHVHGVAVTPERALRGVDVALNAMHGEFGEDGQVQRILEMLAVPYTGSGAAASALAFDKQLTREAVSKLGVKIAHGAVIDSQKITDLERTAFNLFRSMPHPVMVKPTIGGSSVGTAKADSYHGLQTALEHAFNVSPRALVEEYIKGREATVGVIDNFRGEKIYALMPVEIIPPQTSSFFDYDAKYGGRSTERVPGNFSREEKNHLMTAARLVHQGLSLEHYSRSDFIVSRRGIYFLEVNTLPGLTNESLLPKALQAVGAKLSDFLDHVINLARRRQVQ
ncbi:MAG: D-alanine--D-alanine ligase [Patescibacteria group bacterium]|nr:D-alanine--D-alanine ligase [Patescibacteria group bacterium]